MIRFELGNSGVRYGIGFDYSRDEVTKQPVGVEAAILELDEKGSPIALVAAGYSQCHESDNFKKETGRKLALTRAIDKLQLSKSARRSIWRAYFNREREARAAA